MELTDRDPLTQPSPPLAGERKKVRGLLYIKTRMRTIITFIPSRGKPVK